ncbi:MAG: ECF-type sigma factor [Planctomycetota bacterium]
MTDHKDQSLSALLAGLGTGDRALEDELARRLHGELRALAAGQLRAAPSQASLQPTALVHEAWLRFCASDGLTFADRRAFFAFAGTVMRAILVDRARAAAALRRGGDRQRVSLPGGLVEREPAELDLLALEEALAKLEQLDPESAKLIELRFFGGLSHPEIAEITGGSLRSVERRWRFARAWLHSELADP